MHSVNTESWGKWVSEIREPNRGTRLWLGTFNSSYEAAVAYYEAAKKLYGSSSAKLNLPNNGVSSISTSANFVGVDNGEIIVGGCGSSLGGVQDQNGESTSGSRVHFLDWLMEEGMGVGLRLVLGVIFKR
ncbi:hypothetical protein HS088_TW23G00415 [Tripterygium wilfordii]|uniref:AP2/ERF domain-containing protein n=1 Tax=Tripterygium wilfordii TaxID=458696 RepID=A0A7J7BV28_TRIWF|nr:hypothetical protein HS088_TW23G00415 [Tripterygium wilfordii]